MRFPFFRLFLLAQIGPVVQHANKLPMVGSKVLFLFSQGGVV